MSLSVCALSIHVWEQYGPWLPPKAPSLFSLLSHWLNWLMKCSVIQSGEKILTTAMKPNHKGLRWSRERLNERERKMKLKVIILVDLRTPLLFVQQRYHCVFVCLWPSACITRGVSVNQSTLILYTSSPDGCPRLLVDTVYSCFPSADSSHPEEAAQPCLLQTWATFKGSKINHHRMMCDNVMPVGAFKTPGDSMFPARALIIKWKLCSKPLASQEPHWAIPSCRINRQIVCGGRNVVSASSGNERYACSR